MRAWPCLGSLILVACGGSSNNDGPTGPTPPADITGVWTIAAHVSGSQANCSAAGTLTLNQTGTLFNGTFTESSGLCTTPSDQLSGSLDGLVSGGTVNGTEVTYANGPCNLAGQATGTPANSVSGTMSCVVLYQGQNASLTGTWQMTR